MVMAVQLRPWKYGMLATLLLAAGPASSWAGWLGIRNDVKDTLIVQSLPVTNRGAITAITRAKEMAAGEVAWESLLLPGNRLIRIYDNNKVLLYQKTVPVMGDLFFSIQLEPMTNKLLLVPIKAPVKPPGQK
jgi:hypothetical protein